MLYGMNKRDGIADRRTIGPTGAAGRGVSHCYLVCRGPANRAVRQDSHTRTAPRMTICVRPAVMDWNDWKSFIGRAGRTFSAVMTDPSGIASGSEDEHLPDNLGSPSIRPTGRCPASIEGLDAARAAR